jgi:hypothetical protein
MVNDFILTKSLYATLVNPNVTATLNAAVVATDNTYVANRTISVYVVEARNENA